MNVAVAPSPLVLLLGVLTVACLAKSPVDPMGTVDARADDAVGDRDVVAARGIADGGKSDGAPCTDAATSYCVTDCLAPLRRTENLVCSDGVWLCPSPFVIASTCPADGCGVTSDLCCDSLTGSMTARPCDSDGHRQPCLPGWRPQAPYTCIPDALGVTDCYLLDGLPCDGPAVTCQSFVGLETHCSCRATDAGTSRWACSLSTGP